MPKFRKKPVTIKADQWFKNGDHPDDYVGDVEGYDAAYRKEHEWEGGVVRYFRHPTVSDTDSCKHCGEEMFMHGWIDTLEGGHIVCPGDWIITGIQGERYPCKPDIFDATYERLDDATS